MTLQNRVLPTGEIVADPARGSMTGNRGILHGPDRRLGKARWRHKNWICCTLDWQGRRREVMSPNTWTELFFLDEAVAMAAGHRPCAYCRRPAYDAFRDAWRRGYGTYPGAHAVDAILHDARLTPARQQRRHRMDAADIPDGAMVMAPAPMLILGAQAVPFRTSGYGSAIPRPRGAVNALTPPPLLRVLSMGYKPQLHQNIAPESTR